MSKFTLWNNVQRLVVFHDDIDTLRFRTRAQSFVVAAGFKGFKMVPPGPHYLSYNAASRQGEFGPTVAFLAHLAGREVAVRRWSPEHELLLPLADEDEVRCRMLSVFFGCVPDLHSVRAPAHGCCCRSPTRTRRESDCFLCIASFTMSPLSPPFHL